MVCLALPSAFPVHGFCPEIGSVNSSTNVFTAQFCIIREISELFPTKFIFSWPQNHVAQSHLVFMLIDWMEKES